MCGSGFQNNLNGPTFISRSRKGLQSESRVREEHSDSNCRWRIPRSAVSPVPFLTVFRLDDRVVRYALFGGSRDSLLVRVPDS